MKISIVKTNDSFVKSNPVFQLINFRNIPSGELGLVMRWEAN